MLFDITFPKSKQILNADYLIDNIHIGKLQYAAVSSFSRLKLATEIP
jgi:hypothetical protein